jgi:excisionase family DNA binding protein
LEAIASSADESRVRDGGFPAWLSPDEVAKLLELNRHTVYRLLRDGELPGSRIGGRWFVSTEALAARIRGIASA